jgi:prephenate dehydrogenase
MALKHSTSNGVRHDKVAVDTVSVTTHVVHVNLAELLGTYDVTDNVVLMVATPSGRDKRVALGGNFLVDTRADAVVWS